MIPPIRVDQFVDEQKFGSFHLNLFFWSFLAMFADGFDLNALSYAQPELQTLWHVPKAAFGPVVSASLFGILIGAPLFGLVGDRFGRRNAIVASSMIYGFFTLLVVWTHSLLQIEILRLITGIGLGGIMPNTIALNSELAPRRLRARLVTLMFIGITFGSATPGVVAYWLVPQYGWTVLFIVGGIGSVALAAALALRLPESVKFLALRPQRRRELLVTLRRIRPETALADDVAVVADTPPSAGSSEAAGLRQMFKGSLGLITALLWVCFTMALMANFFLNSFLPLIFSSAMDKRQAALLAAIFPVGGSVGGVLISVLVDRFGVIVIAALFALAVPAIAAHGMVHPVFAALAPLTMLSGLAVQGAQFGNNAAAGLLYPTTFRAKGVGWALGIGRFGAVVGPLLGSRLLELPLRQLFLAAAIPMLIGTCAATLLGWSCYKRLGGLQLSDVPIDRRIAGRLNGPGASVLPPG